MQYSCGRAILVRFSKCAPVYFLIEEEVGGKVSEVEGGKGGKHPKD
jgi:hypothetical protein